MLAPGTDRDDEDGDAAAALKKLTIGGESVRDSEALFETAPGVITAHDDNSPVVGNETACHPVDTTSARCAGVRPKCDVTSDESKQKSCSTWRVADDVLTSKTLPDNGVVSHGAPLLMTFSASLNCLACLR